MSKYVGPDDMNFVNKSYGHEQWVHNDEDYCGKILFIKRGKCCSFHKHKLKSETLLIFGLESKVKFVYCEEKDIVDPKDLSTSPLKVKTLVNGDAWEIKPGLYHQMIAESDTTIIEFSTQHFDDDSYRLTTKNLMKQYNLQ